MAAQGCVAARQGRVAGGGAGRGKRGGAGRGKRGGAGRGPRTSSLPSRTTVRLILPVVASRSRRVGEQPACSSGPWCSSSLISASTMYGSKPRRSTCPAQKAVELASHVRGRRSLSSAPRRRMPLLSGPGSCPEQAGGHTTGAVSGRITMGCCERGRALGHAAAPSGHGRRGACPSRVRGRCPPSRLRCSPRRARPPSRVRIKDRVGVGVIVRVSLRVRVGVSRARPPSGAAAPARRSHHC